jgi:hypothetical protein
MVQVRVMRMSVHQGLMRVLVRVRIPAVPVERMLMPMVSIVTMCMSMGNSFVNVLVLMYLGEV